MLPTPDLSNQHGDVKTNHCWGTSFEKPRAEPSLRVKLRLNCKNTSSRSRFHTQWSIRQNHCIITCTKLLTRHFWRRLYYSFIPGKGGLKWMSLFTHTIFLSSYLTMICNEQLNGSQWVIQINKELFKIGNYCSLLYDRIIIVTTLPLKSLQLAN